MLAARLGACISQQVHATRLASRAAALHRAAGACGTPSIARGSVASRSRRMRCRALSRCSCSCSTSTLCTYRKDHVQDPRPRRSGPVARRHATVPCICCSRIPLRRRTTLHRRRGASAVAVPPLSARIARIMNRSTRPRRSGAVHGTSAMTVHGAPPCTPIAIASKALLTYLGS